MPPSDHDTHARCGWRVALREPGAWLVAALIAGALVRVFLVVATEGTLDAVVWRALVDDVRERGLLAVYRHAAHTLNHPPLAVWLATGARELGLATGVPFAVIFRAPFALLDLVTCAGLVALFGAAAEPRWRDARFAVAAFAWLSPIAIVFSSFHGNTDSAVACALVLAAACVARGRPALAGLVLGASLGLKIPGLLAAPLLCLALPDRAGRLRFAACASAAALAVYLPWLFEDPELVLRSVFLYPGLRIQTTSGVQVWGLANFVPDWRDVAPPFRAEGRAVLLAWLRANTLLCVAPIVLLAWARRGRREAVELAAGVAGTYAILYGFTILWSFQYLAWSAPLWIGLGVRFAFAATAVSTAYVWGLYAWLCGSVLLTGSWDFIGKPDWPLALRVARDLGVLFFAAAAVVQVVRALRDVRARWPRRAGVG